MNEPTNAQRMARQLRQRILVEGICTCNRYTILKKTNIFDPRVLGQYVKIPVCTGCIRRESDCDCRRWDGKETLFMNPENQARIWEKCNGKPTFRITGKGDGAIKGIRL